MSIDTALRSILISDPVLSPLIGNRVYPLQFPQNYTKPALIYIPVADVDRDTHQRYKVQVVVHSASYAAGIGILSAVKGAFKRFNSGVKEGYHIYGFLFPGIINYTTDPTVPIYEHNEIFELDYTEV